MELLRFETEASIWMFDPYAKKYSRMPKQESPIDKTLPYKPEHIEFNEYLDFRMLLPNAVGNEALEIDLPFKSQPWIRSGAILKYPEQENWKELLCDG